MKAPYGNRIQHEIKIPSQIPHQLHEALRISGFDPSEVATWGLQRDDDAYQVLVTPPLAASWLKRNLCNRPVTQGAVLYLANEMKQGTWQHTHQGICFNKEGVLLDGQHRLHAVIVAGVAVWMNVRFNQTQESVLGYSVDGGRNRKGYEIRQISKNENAIYTELLSIYYYRNRKFNTAEFDVVQKVVGNTVAAFLDELHGRRNGVSNAPFRCPVYLRWMLHGAEAVEQYNALVALNYDAMWPHIRSLVTAMTKDPKRFNCEAHQLMCMVWDIFNPEKRGSQRLASVSVSSTMHELKAAIAQIGLSSELDALKALRLERSHKASELTTGKSLADHVSSAANS